MKRIKIFFRLKAEEIWPVLRTAPKVIGIGLCVICVWWLFGFVVHLLTGIPMDITEMVLAGELLSIGLGCVTLLCWGAIVFKRWIQSNWKLAGELAQYE